MKLENLNLKQVPFKDYYFEAKPKTQIYLHHTAGGPNGENVFGYWDRTKVRVATCVAISQDGTIVQGFSSKYWAYHLGLKSDVFRAHGLPYKSLDPNSIGIEICAYGYLKKKGKVFKNYVGGTVLDEEVITLEKPFKGHKYWHKYSPAQIQSVIDLLKYWSQEYGIDVTYKDDIWDVTERALKGENGVYTHNSVRTDKLDIYPDPDLIAAWKEL